MKCSGLSSQALGLQPNIRGTDTALPCRKFDRFGDWFVFRRLPALLRWSRRGDAPMAGEYFYDFPHYSWPHK
jgi:hypothetical protein